MVTKEVPNLAFKKYQDACPGCGKAKARKSPWCVWCSPNIRGPAHYAWKGDGALTVTKRRRAQAMYKLETCERCGEKPGVDRHHIDGDVGNNARSNIMILCRRCHMTIDGRLEAFGSHKTEPKSHCKHGHEFTFENTRIRPGGYRVCRECHKLTERKRRAAKRAQGI